MLVLRSLVRDGIVPLLGPPTSIGDVHHGAWYYYLLSPAACLTGGDSPLAVVALIALAGIAAVGVVVVAGALDRRAGRGCGRGPADGRRRPPPSTNRPSSGTRTSSPCRARSRSPAAWRAWSGGDRRWWLVAAVGTAVTMQCHVLGRRAAARSSASRSSLDCASAAARRGACSGVARDLRRRLPAARDQRADHGLLGGRGQRSGTWRPAGRRPRSALPVRFGIVALRVVSWPLDRLITDGFVAGAARDRRRRRDRRLALARDRRLGAIRASAGSASGCSGRRRS